VLDRVLDKGTVIDAWVRVSLIGIDLVTVEARVVVASIETYFKYSELLAQRTPSTLTRRLPCRICKYSSQTASRWPHPRPQLYKLPVRGFGRSARRMMSDLRATRRRATGRASSGISARHGVTAAP